MDIFQIGHKVKILERCLPTSNLVANNCFLIIGMHGRTVQVSGHRGILSEKRFNNFIVLMPFGCGWPLSDLSPHDREVYMISKLYFDRDFWGWNVSESEITSPDIAKADGAQCLKCKDFVYMAPADGSFICRSCVLDPYRCSSVWNGDD